MGLMNNSPDRADILATQWRDKGDSWKNVERARKSCASK